MIRSYILIEVDAGRERAVIEEVKKLKLAEAEIESVDAVTGPFDVIVIINAPTIDQIARGVTRGIQSVKGVQRTTTCLVAELA